MIRFGTLGAARITPPALIKPCEADPRAAVTVVGARSRERAEGFAKKHYIPVVVEDYASVVNHSDVDVVYVPLPITAHHEWTIKSLRAGKHVLCEKSFASNAEEAMEMAAVAKETGLVVMDAFHYRYHPIFVRAREIYTSGRLGAIELVSASFHIPVTDPGDIRMNYNTAGGVTMDIGCYPISWVRHMTGLEPEEVAAVAETGPPDVDVYLTAELVFPGQIKGCISGDMRTSAKFKAEIIVAGEKGTMTVNNPIAPHMGNSIELNIDGEVTQEQFDHRPTYSYQLDAFINAVENGGAVLTGPDDAVNQMKLIDRCYETAGLPLRGK
ncbi:MAG: Gfo/Idh/MocA family oxidoreductase [bacterium]|nr:Gfo/Idh/MocA family oxidoreductase [Gammaproteobacteria bacterium]